MEKINYKNKKIWNPEIIIVFSVLFTFLPAALMFSINYWKFGLKKSALLNIFLAMILLLVNIYFEYTSIAISLGYAMFIAKQQTPLYNVHVKNKGHKRRFIIPMVLLAITAALTVLLFFIKVDSI